MIEHTVNLASAYFSNNEVSPDKVKDVIRDIHSALHDQGEEKPKPAVPIEDSVHDDYLVCLEDGKHLKVLKRYLRETHGMTPEEYREKWGLPDDYPMVCKNYSKRRSGLAKKQGLGVTPSR